MTLNSLYITGDTYKDTPFKYVNGYYVAVLGLLALAKKFPDSPLIHTYLNRPAPLSDDAIFANGDRYTDCIAAVKVLYEKGLMPYPAWLRYCSYFRELASKKYKNFDDSNIIQFNKKMIQTEIRPHQLIQGVVFDYMNKKIPLEKTLQKLFEFNEIYKLSPNFRQYCMSHKKDLG